MIECCLRMACYLGSPEGIRILFAANFAARFSHMHRIEEGEGRSKPPECDAMDARGDAA